MKPIKFDATKSGLKFKIAEKGEKGIMIQEQELCNICGKDMKIHEDLTLIGLQLEVTSDEKYQEQVVEAMKPYSVDKKYKVCFPCWLGKLGIKP